MNDCSDAVSSLNGEGEDAIVAKAMGVEIRDVLDAMVVDDNKKMAGVEAGMSLDEQDYQSMVAEIEAGMHTFDIAQFTVV